MTKKILIAMIMFLSLIGDCMHAQHHTDLSRKVIVVNGDIKAVTSASDVNQDARVWIPSSINEIPAAMPIHPSYFENTEVAVFESDSKLRRLWTGAFSASGLISVFIPSSVEVIGSGCFSWCKSLISIIFESGSGITRIEDDAFLYTPIGLSGAVNALKSVKNLEDVTIGN
jgi:hypothetical protein